MLISNLIFKRFYPDHSFDLVFASHVLEYVEEDRQAIAEIKGIKTRRPCIASSANASRKNYRFFKESPKIKEL